MRETVSAPSIYQDLPQWNHAYIKIPIYNGWQISNWYLLINKLSQYELNPFVGFSNVTCSTFNMDPVYIDIL